MLRFNNFKNFLMEEDAVGTVELVFIIVILIAIVVLFRKQLKELIEKLFQRISRDTSKL